MSFSITILGCSSSIPTNDRNPSGQIINYHDKLYLIDCAEGTQLQLRRYVGRIQRLHAVFISHLHGDHFFGLVGLVSTLHLLGRNKVLHIYGPQGLEEIIRLQLSYTHTELIYELIFHLTNPEVSELIFDEGELQVTTIPLDHRIPTHGFLFREKPGLRKIKKEIVLSEKIPYSEYENLKLGADYITADGTVIPNSSLTVSPPIPRSYAYCSDTRYTESIIPLIKDVDILYHEATFLKELSEQATLKYHSTAEQAAQIALLSGAKKLIIGHYSARYDDLNPLLEEAKSIFPETELAQDGLTMTVRKKLVTE
ncbi:MAG: ribonuclease Z [Bacteroidota bacterium]|nr:ribonuclease Z [Bacteroidota bacterium]